MIKYFAILLPFIIGSFVRCQHQKNIPVNDILQFAYYKYAQTAHDMNPQHGIPRTTSSDGRWIVRPASDWTSGFYPGVLWQLYDFSHNKDMKQLAETWTAQIEGQKNCTDTHDVGFQIFCSFGNGYRLTNDPEYKVVLLQTAASLNSRFNQKVGAIKSWDWQPDPPQ
jgi:unsaturated chondroitin disaccharide hydrolase